MHTVNASRFVCKSVCVVCSNEQQRVPSFQSLFRRINAACMVWSEYFTHLNVCRSPGTVSTSFCSWRRCRLTTRTSSVCGASGEKQRRRMVSKGAIQSYPTSILNCHAYASCYCFAKSLCVSTSKPPPHLQMCASSPTAGRMLFTLRIYPQHGGQHPQCHICMDGIIHPCMAL